MKMIRRAQRIRLTKGAISLLLALVMSPMLSIALTLVESARYQDAAATMREVVDLSGFSTIADYDEYLDERFNLMCVSQETEFKTAFDSYLNENIKAMGAAVAVNSTTLGGEYPLSNVDVLRQQLVEYGELSIPTEEILEGLDVKQLFDNLVKESDLKAIKSFADTTSESADAVSELVDIVESVANLKTKFTELATAQTEAAGAYTDFQNAILEYCSEVDKGISSKMKELQKPTLTDSEMNEVMSSSSVTNAWRKVETTKSTYSGKLQTWIDKVDAAAKLFDEVYASTNAISEKLGKAKKSNADAWKAVNKSSESGAEESLFDHGDYALMIVNKILDALNKNAGDDMRTKAANDKNLITNLRASLVDMKQSDVSLSWTADDISKKYTVDMTKITVVGSFWQTIWNDLKEDFDNQTCMDEEAVESLSALADLYASLLGVSFVYDGSLNARIDTSLLVTKTSPSFSAQEIIKSMNSFTEAVEELKSAEGLKGVVNILKGLYKLLKGVVQFLTAVIGWCIDTARCLWDFGSRAFQAKGGEDLILYGYGVYNMPNRTNVTGKSMTGYNYTKLFQMAGGDLSAYHNTFAGTLDSIAETDQGSGSAELFKGAEAEYLIAGSSDEIQNQGIVFFDLFMLRILLDIVPIIKNPEVAELSAHFGPCWLAGYILIAIAEPLVECLLLVNGSKDAVYLINSPIYLTPTKLPLLVKELPKIAGLPKNVESGAGKVSDKWLKDKGLDSEAQKALTKTSKCKASYSEHLLLLMICCVKESEYMTRLQNLIQLEGRASHKGDYVFDLTKTYTFVTAEVDYQLNPMFNLDGLSNGGSPFKIKTKQYVGY